MKHEILTYLNYSEDARLDAKALKAKYGDNVHYIENKKTDTQCFVYVRSPYNIIIAFRGTQQLRDWLTDFDAFHTIYPYDNTNSDIQVHKGFIKAYKSVRDKIHAIIESCPLVTSIVVCGHSLGGSLATLCAVDLQYNYNNRSLIRCFPSGNPRVGNKAFVDSYNKRVPFTYRTYMRTDIVPTLPPRSVEKIAKGGYKHTAQGVPIGPWNPFIGIMNWFRKTFRNVTSILAQITNHSIPLYRKYLEK